MRYFLIFSLLFAFHSLTAQDMTLKRMNKIFKAEVEEMEREDGIWTMSYGDLPVMVVSDERANRMRIFTPITTQASLDDDDLEIMLVANFHSALDAKYALYEGFVVSLFTHPLRELQEEQLIDALRQVVVLAKTFGTTYSSTEMIFGGDTEEEKEPKINTSPLQPTKRS